MRFLLSPVYEVFKHLFSSGMLTQGNVCGLIKATFVAILPVNTVVVRVIYPTIISIKIIAERFPIGESPLTELEVQMATQRKHDRTLSLEPDYNPRGAPFESVAVLARVGRENK